MTDQIKEEILEIDSDQLEELLGGSDNDKLPPIEIAMEHYDTDEFYRGIHETSHLAGVITAILNAGVSEGFVLDYLLNKATIEHNIKAAELNKEMNIEVARNQRIVADKHEL
jgi:hypothetical protein